MMKELKKTIKLHKYAYQYKMNVCSGILFIVLGACMVLIRNENSMLLGGVYIMLGPMMMQQIGCTLLYCNLVASSGQKRFLETVYSDVIIGGTSILVYGVTIVFCVIKQQFQTEPVHLGNVAIATAFCLAAVLCYYGFAMKYFVVGIILFALSYIVTYYGGATCIKRDFFQFELREAALIGLVVVIVGNIIGILLRRLFYKRPISKAGAGAELRKSMV